jgi:hypothetical protein
MVDIKSKQSPVSVVSYFPYLINNVFMYYVYDNEYKYYCDSREEKSPTGLIAKSSTSTR